jgi:hypothetical protein
MPWSSGRPAPRFQQYELVRVSQPNAVRDQWRGRVGEVAFPPNQDGGTDWYCVEFEEDVQAYFSVDELEGTGAWGPRYYLQRDHPSPFQLFEQVRITSSEAKDTDLIGEKGAIAGTVQDRASGQWWYAVWLYRQAVTYYVGERQLTSLGQIDHVMEREAQFSNGPSIRVRVDAEGNGYLVDE